MKNQRSLLPLLAAALSILMIPAHAATVQVPTGSWKGAIELPGAKLEIVINLKVDESTGAWSGTIDIPAQGLKNFALARVHVAGADVTFALPGVPGDPTFTGQLSEDGDTIKGTFAQSGHTFPFHLARETAPAATAKERI